MPTASAEATRSKTTVQLFGRRNSPMTSQTRVSRRMALKGLAAGTAAWAGAAVLTHAAKPSSGGCFVERQPTGAEIWQVTTESFDQSDIYGELPYCSCDSRYFVYARRNPALKMNRTEFVVVELGTWKQQRLDTGISISGCAMSHDGLFYYLKRTENGATNLMRSDLTNGQSTRVYQLPHDLTVRSLGTVTTDGRHYAGGTMTEPGWKMFNIVLVDLQKGEQRILDRDPYILNPHPQFEPGEGRMLMVQHNRGGRYSPEGKLEQLVGEEGATLYLLSVPDGGRTELQVGTPYTTPCTGHEAWIGTTGEMLLSVSASGQFSCERGNLLAVRTGQPPRVVARGYRFNHVGVSRCGRLFAADDWQPPYRIIVGSTQSEHAAVICESKTTPTSSQNTHPHPYVTPDLKWVIFNSNRTGRDHVYAARIPDDQIANLLA